MSDAGSAMKLMVSGNQQQQNTAVNDDVNPSTRTSVEVRYRAGVKKTTRCTIHTRVAKTAHWNVSYGLYAWVRGERCGGQVPKWAGGWAALMTVTIESPCPIAWTDSRISQCLRRPRPQRPWVTPYLI